MPAHRRIRAVSRSSARRRSMRWVLMGNYNIGPSGLIDITDYLNSNSDGKLHISILLNKIMPLNWPEAPSNEGFILIDRESGVLTTHISRNGNTLINNLCTPFAATSSEGTPPLS